MNNGGVECSDVNSTEVVRDLFSEGFGVCCLNVSDYIPSKTIHFSTLFCRVRATSRRVSLLSVTINFHVCYDEASYTINVAVVDTGSRRIPRAHVTATQGMCA
jgi:hypothetical protein